MSYSNSEKAVHAVSHFLDAIYNLKGDSIAWTTANPNALAYKIRQAMAICAAHKENYPFYWELKSKFRIKVNGSIVRASRIVPIADLSTEVTAQSFAKSVTTFDVPDVKEVMEAVGAIIANPNFEEYAFPDYTEISDSELNRIYKYTSRNDLYIVKSKHLVITKREPPEGVEWKPILKAI